MGLCPCDANQFRMALNRFASWSMLNFLNEKIRDDNEIKWEWINGQWHIAWTWFGGFLTKDGCLHWQRLRRSFDPWGFSRLTSVSILKIGRYFWGQTRQRICSTHLTLQNVWCLLFSCQIAATMSGIKQELRLANALDALRQWSQTTFERKLTIIPFLSENLKGSVTRSAITTMAVTIFNFYFSSETIFSFSFW